MDVENRRSARRHRDVYRSFYTTDDRLISYMIGLLGPRNGDFCLEPAAGNGCFIDGLLASSKALTIRAIEIAPVAIAELRAKYATAANVEVLEQDFLTEGAGLFDALGTFDRVIGNPPYGAWQTYERRLRLRAHFPNLYVRETYGLFMARGLSRLRANGRLVFIIPETFLYLHLQKNLRRLLLDLYSIASIDILPSRLFPGVSFGYAKLCIIAVDNRRASATHDIRIRHCDSIDKLTSNIASAIGVSQRSVLQRQDFSFPLLGHTQETKLIDTAPVHLGDIADCVTGIYTGNDSVFLRRSADNPRGFGRYMNVNQEQVCSPDHLPLKRTGLTGRQVFVPLLKGGGSPYYKPERWFIDWREEAVDHYKTDEKARFQNSKFYFQLGIGFPMVTSGRATASIIREHWLFDQSVVGVFPRQQELFGFVLAFLNSPVCWSLLRQINPSANNSAKYIRKLPIVLPPAPLLSWFNEVFESYLPQLIGGGERRAGLEAELDRRVVGVFSSS